MSARRLHEIGLQLADRDWQLLATLNQHGFVTTDQVQRFVFIGHASQHTAERTTRRVLARLERDGLVRALPRRQGGVLGGSTPATWQLAPAGARLIREQRAAYRTRLPTSRHLRHCLAVAETHLAVRQHAAAADLTATVAVERTAWQPYAGLGGEQLWIKPDLAVELRGRDEQGPYEDHWFIEVDLGTESLPTLVRKCEQYERYRRSGQQQAATGTFPLVLWLFDNPRRVAQLQRTVIRSSRLSPALYRYGSLEDVGTALSAAAGEAS